MNKPETDEIELIVISEQESGQRLDQILAQRYSEIRSRTYFQKLIEQKSVLVNGEPVKKRIKLNSGDEVEIFFQAAPELHIQEEPIPLNILYEDEDLLIINKPAGIVVHPAPGNWSGTILNALMHHCQLPSHTITLNDPIPRPGIVHRLDKDTSGVLVTTKNSVAQEKVMEQFASRSVHKEYIAICRGNPGEGKIEAPIGRHPVDRKKMSVRKDGRKAVTHIQTLGSDGKLSVVHCVLETGRTHQIRVHLQYRGAPVLGDEVYGGKDPKVKRQLLHAHKIQFLHPTTGKEVAFTAAIPEDMQPYLNRIVKEI